MIKMQILKFIIIHTNLLEKTYFGFKEIFFFVTQTSRFDHFAPLSHCLVVFCLCTFNKDSPSGDIY